MSSTVDSSPRQVPNNSPVTPPRFLRAAFVLETPRVTRASVRRMQGLESFQQQGTYTNPFYAPAGTRTIEHSYTTNPTAARRRLTFVDVSDQMAEDVANDSEDSDMEPVAEDGVEDGAEDSDVELLAETVPLNGGPAVPPLVAANRLVPPAFYEGTPRFQFYVKCSQHVDNELGIIRLHETLKRAPFYRERQAALYFITKTMPHLADTHSLLVCLNITYRHRWQGVVDLLVSLGCTVALDETDFLFDEALVLYREPVTV